MDNGFERWWAPDSEGSYYDRVWQVIDSVLKDQDSGEDWWKLCLSAYLGYPVSSLNPNLYHQARRQALLKQPFNALRSSIDAIEAIVSKAEPRPVFEVDQSEGGLQRKAQNQAQATRAIFIENNAYEKIVRSFRDAMVGGSGLAHVYAQFSSVRTESGELDKTAQIKIDYVMPWEVFVDPHDAYHGEPRSIFRVKLIDRDVAIAMAQSLPEGKRKKAVQAIKDAPMAGAIDKSNNTSGAAMIGRASDQIRIAYACRLASAPGAQDGRQVICVDGGDISSEIWHDDKFPFIKHDWTTAHAGYWGRGIVEEAGGLQRSFADQARLNEATFETQSKPVWQFPETERESANGLSADKVRVLFYKVAPGHRITDPVVHPQILDRERYLQQLTFEQTGANQLSAQSLKPAGLSSGKALRDFRDLTSERFAPKARQLDKFIAEIADAVAKCARRAESLGYRVVSRLVESDGERTRAMEYKWSELLPEGTPYKVTVDVASSVSRSVSGRNSDLQDLLNVGAISRERFIQQYDLPDTQRILKRESAPLDLIDMQIDKMRNGERVIPEPTQARLDLALREASLAHDRAMLDGATDNTLQSLREYIVMVKKEIERQQLAELQKQQALAMAAAPPQPQQPEAQPAQEAEAMNGAGAVA